MKLEVGFVKYLGCSIINEKVNNNIFYNVIDGILSILNLFFKADRIIFGSNIYLLNIEFYVNKEKF